jgi:hypothetical protein
MVHGWIRHKLAAYALGELNPAQAQRIEAHLQACVACRQEVEAIRVGIARVQELPRLKAPDDLWQRLEPKLETTVQIGRSAVRDLKPPFQHRRGYAIGMALAGICIAVFRLWAGRTVTPLSGPTWEVTRLTGTPRVGTQAVAATGRIGVGEWLSTDGTSQARLKVANIGEVVLEANSRLRLRVTRKEEHRLELQRGTLHAHILAPPRLFLVDTPATRAIDLGCAYTLTVNDSGDSQLHVTSGQVALVRREGGEVVVPAGAACVTRQGVGPGTPVFEDASLLLRDALARYDFEHGGEAALKTVLAEARSRDTLTLWYLFVRVPESDRGRVYDRLVAFIPPPPGVNRAEMLRLDPKTAEAWRGEMEQDWLGG